MNLELYGAYNLLKPEAAAKILKTSTNQRLSNLIRPYTLRFRLGENPKRPYFRYAAGYTKALGKACASKWHTQNPAELASAFAATDQAQQLVIDTLASYQDFLDRAVQQGGHIFPDKGPSITAAQLIRLLDISPSNLLAWMANDKLKTYDAQGVEQGHLGGNNEMRHVLITDLGSLCVWYPPEVTGPPHSKADK